MLLIFLEISSVWLGWGNLGVNRILSIGHIAEYHALVKLDARKNLETELRLVPGGFRVKLRIHLRVKIEVTL